MDKKPRPETPLPTMEALADVRSLCAFAYENGYHEHGYDPLLVLETALENAREFVALKWSHQPDCQNIFSIGALPCDCGLRVALSDLGAKYEQ